MKRLGISLILSTKKSRLAFFEQLERVVSWTALVQILEPYVPSSTSVRPPFPVETMLRIHCLQQWFGLANPAMAEALHDISFYREFTGVGRMTAQLPDRFMNLRVQRQLDQLRLHR